MRKVFVITVGFILCLFCISNVYAIDISSVADELDLNELIDTLEEYTNNEIDIEDITDDLLTGNGIDYGIIGDVILNKVFGQIRLGLKSCLSILIVVILMSITKSIELENDSNISKITNIVGFLIIVTISLKSYYTILNVFTNTIELLTGIMEIVAPFMLAILITTGEITTSGIIGPVILFVTSLIGVLVNFVILPLLTVSLVFKIISNMSKNIKLDKFSQFFSSASMWIISVLLAVFLGVMELQSSLTTSIDSVTIKATQAAVSNLIPVVGKFVSDSVEVVMGASEIIGKAVGIIGVVVIIIVALVPIIKIILYNLMYYIVAAVSELLNADSNITNLCESMSKQYKTMLGIMLGVMVTFVIGIGIVIKLMGKVVG